MTISTLLLQAASPSAGLGNIIFLVGFILVTWLFFFRPQAKRQREQGDFMKNLAKGDEVVTSSGIIGKINKIDDKSVTLEVGKTFLQFTKNAISKEMTDAYFNSEDKN